MPWLAGATIGSALLGGLFGNSAQSKANKTNIMLSRETRDWEERMANSAYQRATQDMAKAGLNPMLAYSQGGAQTPQAPTAHVEPVDALAKAMPQAGSALAMAAQVQKTQAETRLINENADQQGINTRRMIAETIGGGDLPPSMQDIRWGKERDAATQQRADAQMATTNARILKALETTKVSSAKTQAQILQQDLTFNEARNTLQELKIPEARAIADWFETVGMGSPLIKATMSITQWLKIILGR